MLGHGSGSLAFAVVCTIAGADAGDASGGNSVTSNCSTTLDDNTVCAFDIFISHNDIVHVFDSSRVDDDHAPLSPSGPALQRRISVRAIVVFAQDDELCDAADQREILDASCGAERPDRAQPELASGHACFDALTNNEAIPDRVELRGATGDSAEHHSLRHGPALGLIEPNAMDSCDLLAGDRGERHDHRRDKVDVIGLLVPPRACGVKPEHAAT